MRSIILIKGSFSKESSRKENMWEFGGGIPGVEYMCCQFLSEKELKLF